jgi:hypothetical protein
VDDQIGFQVPGRRVVPIGKGADGNTLSEGGGDSSSLLCPLDTFPHGTQQAVDRGGADGQDLLPHAGVKMQMIMLFHGCDQHRKQRLQAFTTESVGGFPQQRQCILYRFLINASAKPGLFRLPLIDTKLRSNDDKLK